MADLGKILLVPKGTYSSSTTYDKLDWVRSGTRTWVSKVNNNIGHTPPTNDTDNEYWALLAKDGTGGGGGGDAVWGSITGDIEAQTDLQTALNLKANTDDVTTALAGKVDTVAGKGLSKNDYTDADKAIVDGVTSALAEKSSVDANPTLAGTESSLEGIEIDGTKYKVGGGHTMVEQGSDKGITNLEAITAATDNKVVNAYTVRAYANSFKYKFISTINAGHNSIGEPIEDKTTWSSATETAAGWMFSGEFEQAVRDLLIGLDLNESANLDWRFDPVAAKTGLSVVRWQFDTTTGMMCFVFNQNVEVATNFCVDLELLRKWDDLV